MFYFVLIFLNFLIILKATHMTKESNEMKILSNSSTLIEQSVEMFRAYSNFLNQVSEYLKNLEKNKTTYSESTNDGNLMPFFILSSQYLEQINAINDFINNCAENLHILCKEARAKMANSDLCMKRISILQNSYNENMKCFQTINVILIKIINYIQKFCNKFNTCVSMPESSGTENITTINDILDTIKSELRNFKNKRDNFAANNQVIFILICIKNCAPLIPLSTQDVIPAIHAMYLNRLFLALNDFIGLLITNPRLDLSLNSTVIFEIIDIFKLMHQTFIMINLLSDFQLPNSTQVNSGEVKENNGSTNLEYVISQLAQIIGIMKKCFLAVVNYKRDSLIKNRFISTCFVLCIKYTNSILITDSKPDEFEIIKLLMDEFKEENDLDCDFNSDQPGNRSLLTTVFDGIYSEQFLFADVPRLKEFIEVSQGKK